MLNRLGVRSPALLGLVFLIGTAAHAQTGRIAGQLTDQASSRPLPDVEVTVVGSDGVRTRARTDAAGRYVLANVAAGNVRLRARILGHVAQERSVTVRADETVTADFALPMQSIQLDQVVVTGTGGAVERRAVGNVIESINADQVREQSAARSVEQLIGARAPGVIVLPSTGQIGTGAQVRIRSVGSLTLGTDPIVYIDGVRMDADAAQGPAQRGGAGASRLNDVNPADIESIEIIKGPAAATLYGTEASNGVVQIITKRGKSGVAHWDFETRQGTNWLANPEGRTGLVWARDATTGQLVSMNLYQRELEQGHGPVFTNGSNQGYALNLRGGVDAARYYLSSSYDRDVGVVPWNWEKKFGGRANIDVEPMTKLRLQGSLGYIRDRIRLAQPGDINPDPFSNLVWGRLSNIPTTNGFGFAPRELWDDVENHADNDRTTTSLTAQHDPFSWFTQRVVLGYDVNSENNWSLTPRETPQNAGFLNNGTGAKSVERAMRSFLSFDYAGNLKYAFRAVDFTSTVGLQHYRSEASNSTASGTVFPATPITVVTGTTTRNGTETYVANATVGMFVQEQAAWKDRLFLTAALRGDDNSAFGKQYKAAYYPKVSASWVVSEEPFFRDRVPYLPRLLGDLRLRAAYGAAGTQPGAFDAARLYGPSPGYLNQPGLIPSSFGNPELKPEKSSELELGFETTILEGRMDVSYTHFGRNVQDAIVNLPVEPSLGFPNNQVVNLGKVKAWGNELAANLRVLRTRNVEWSLGTQLANNGNEIKDLGGQQFFTVGGGGQAQNRVGFGIADFFMYKVRSATLSPTGTVLSAICDGGTGKQGVMQGGPDFVCVVNGSLVPGATRVYWGHSQPTWQMGFNSSVTLWEDLSLYARVDGNGGHLQSNTEIRALHNQGSTKAVIEQNDPFLQTYRIIEADAPGTYKAGFLKLREVSATYNIKPRFVRYAGASRGMLTVAGRNLSMLWTAQQGWNTARDGEIFVDVAGQHVWDPEIRAVGSRSNGYQTIMPPTASFIASLRLSY
jgi:TonB-linked SusC/RagA family outer membrane protein